MSKKKQEIKGILGITQESDLANKIEYKKKTNSASKSDDISFATASDNGYGGTTSVRRDIAGSITRTDRYKNIEEGIVPFRYSATIYGSNNRAMIDVRDAVILCQKCYYNFAIFRNIIDLMTEFSIGDLYFRGGSQKNRDFFRALFNKINMWDFQDKFYREYYRGGNVFTYRFDATLEPEDVKRITQVFGSESDDIQNLNNIEKMQIPSRYVILNPADIHMVGTANFGFGIYYKLLTAFELARLKNPQTEEDKLVFQTFSPEIQRQIMSGIQSVLVPLDIKKVLMVFYKKQDYEPFSIPMGFPVLEDINFKAELKKIDMAICRTMQQIILLVTTGTEPEKGGINPKNIKGIRDLFQNLSVGRVLVADYTTKAEFIIPDIGELLNPQKYEIVERDINTGLNNVFAGDEKFANQQQKVEIFMSRLDQAKQAFLNNFLIPEIKRISQSLGFKNYPTPYFKTGRLQQDINMARLYERLIEMGILTAEEGLEAMQTNTLPDPELMQQHQQDYKKQRDDGFYTPLVVGVQSQTAKDTTQMGIDNPTPTTSGSGSGSAGRPSGTKSAQTTKTVSPIGTSKASEQFEQKFSLKQVVSNMKLAEDLEKEICTSLKEIHNIKRFSKIQKAIASDLTNLVIANETPENWKLKAKEYCHNPIDKNLEQVSQVNKIAITHSLDPYLAGILFHSPKEIENQEEKAI
jgi:hypothetical protein